MELTTQTVRTIMHDINAFLLDYGQQHGIDIKTVSASIKGVRLANLRIECRVPSASGRSLDEECFISMAHLYGLDKSDLYRNFDYKGQTFQVIGLAPRSTKYPIIAINSMAKKFKFAAADVKKGFPFRIPA